MGYTTYKILKANGGYRTISKPDAETMLFSRSHIKEVQKRHDELIEDNGHIHSYIEGRSPRTLIEGIYSYLEGFPDMKFDIFYIDIVNFFGSIPKIAVDLMGFPTNLWPILNGDSDTGIPQGNPISPLISNIYGYKYIDQKLYINFVRELSHFKYLRYCDNIYIVAPKTLFYSRARTYNIISETLKGIEVVYGLKSKLWVRGNHQKNIILGMRLGKTRPQLPAKQWVRSLIYRIATKGISILDDKDIQKKFGRISYDDFLVRATGYINYAIEVDPTLSSYATKHLEEEAAG